MRRLFSKSSKTPSPAPASAPVPVTVPRLQPAYTVPPVPHPCPYDHIALLATPNGLLLRPYPTPTSHVRISWSKNPRLTEVDGDGDHDWNESVVVYGIVGILDLYSTSYLLVITAKENAGNLFEPTHTVFTVKGITAIPLAHDRAQITLNTLSSRNLRPSLLPSSTIDTLAPSEPESSESTPDTPRVQFSEAEHIKILTPPAEQSEFPLTAPLSIPDVQSDSASEISTPDTSPATPVTKTIANRLSFWSRLSKRQSSLFSSSSSASITSSAPSDVSEPLIRSPVFLKETQVHLETIIDESKAEPKAVITTIINETAPPPATTEEKHSELEDKILRECVREFVRGGMYFAYTFDITRSLQHKQELVAKAKKQSELLDDLLPPKDKDRKGKDKDKGPNSPTRKAQDKEPHVHSAGHIHEGDKVNPLAEPNPTLPLWRRVDKQFWWNEWLSKPLIDAGLHSYILPLMQGYYQFAQITFPPDDLTHPTALTVDYILVSRRSKERAGLRYQRRGIDDEACVANFVESEMIMGVERGDGESGGKSKSIFGYVQIRGSIPLYWTQTSYGLKPPPILSTNRTHAQNLDAMKKHLERLKTRYVSPSSSQELQSPKDKDAGGEITIINLAEQGKTSKEHEVAGGFGKGVSELAEKGLTGVGYHDYDFHVETKGMKYENISKLVDRMEKTFESQGYLWILNDEIMSQQKGAFRVNCIDCLDRTNVVQVQVIPEHQDAAFKMSTA
ncbi:hypothetical protein K435DRAFT_869083 [Dendrothele bispora CBS 962.96]|uniref:SAC domain-containing protein n=1 Tax=Dendrothele bispora (strain CBS 962.96) TaxID=1314807 RepID=A0A4S8LAU3_DENBC|nr:hypothetical protein K435DRAFT_869083 [Dendrothele bispora CBS 962.96]